MKKSLKILSVLLALALVLSVGVIITAAADTTVMGYDDGRTFTSSDELSMTNPLTAQPRTFKARINVPEGVSTRGVMLGNYREADISCLNFQINAAGNPELYFIDSSKVVTTVTFDGYDVRGQGWLDLAVTHTVTDTGSAFVCYVNGAEVDTATSELPLNISLASCQRQYRFALGHDWYSSNYYFKGTMNNLAIYDTALSADEIATLYTSGDDLANTSLMAYYDLGTEANKTGVAITDSTAADHDFEALFQETRRDFDYDYSIAVIPDTQHLVYDDAHKNTQWLSYIYDWLAKNKTDKNIKFVMSVGDITHRDGKDDVDDGVDKTNVEWDITVEQLNKLYEAGLPYSLIVGNHDSVAQLDKYFAQNPNFTDEGVEIGYYSGTSLGNYWMKFTANSTTEYLVLCLDYGPNDDKLAWAGSVIEQNPDCKVIITTHAYMCADGTTLEATDSTSVPRPAEDASAEQKTKNNGDDIWHELASRYENVVLVFSGHISASDIIYRKDYGDNGNTVYQMLLDFQTMDAKYSRQTGMIGMFYFSEDGTVVNAEYVSAYKSLKAQEAEPTAKDIVFRPAVNSFSFEYPDESEWAVGEECEYGVISPTYSDAELYPVLLFRSDKTFIGGFYDLNRAIESIASVYNSNTDSYIVYMRGDTVDTGEVDPVAFGSFNGELVIDLNGTTVTNKRTNYLMVFTFTGTNANHPKITFKDGTLVKDGNTLGLIKLDYNSTLSADAYCDITLDNVTFRALASHNNVPYVAFVTYEGGYGTATGTVNVNAVFNNCTFDFTGSVAKAVMIPMRHHYYTAKDQVIFNTTVNGGTALAASASEFANYMSIVNDDTNGRADSIKYGRNSDGNYISLVLPTGATSPTASVTGTSGETCAFNKVSSDETNDTYTLINATALETKYGTLGAEYENAELYPVVLFRADSSTSYTFIGAYANFNSASAALTYNKNYVILLRNNATSSAVKKMDSFTGTYTVDLNGYTLTQTSGDLFSINRTAMADPFTVKKFFTLNFSNGTIINKSDRPIVAVNYGSGSAATTSQSYSISVDFDNVTFKTNNDKYAIFANWETGYSKAVEALKVLVNATFDDCTFDYTGVGSDFVMIDMGDDGDVAKYNRTIYNVTINGGTIISPNAFSKSEFLYMNDNTSTTVTGSDGTSEVTLYWGDTVTFGQNENGEYISLVLPNSVAAPATSETYTSTTATELAFAKVYDSGDDVVYRLRPTSTLGISFTPKMSLSLDRNLVMKVYIPAEILVKFTFDGTDYENLTEAGLTTTTIDEALYYVLEVSLPASQAARDVKLSATVSVGEGTATATVTFSVIKYAEKLIANGTDAEAQLAKDILSYIRAAYVYFKSTDTEAVEKIDTVLGDGYDEANLPTVEGSDTSVTDGLEGATLVLSGEPSIRFYLTYEASSYKFYIDGAQVDVIEGSDDEGAYVDVDVYAYKLCETVTYTVDTTDGEMTGSFHINAYYAYVSGSGYTDLDKESLVSVTARFWKYLQSARAYKNSLATN